MSIEAQFLGLYLRDWEEMIAIIWAVKVWRWTNTTDIRPDFPHLSQCNRCNNGWKQRETFAAKIRSLLDQFKRLSGLVLTFLASCQWFCLSTLLGPNKDIVDIIKHDSNVLQMFTLMLHAAADNSDDWEGHYHYVDLSEHGQHTGRQSFKKQYLFSFFTGLLLNSQKIASSQKCRKSCHQVQLTNLEGGDFRKYITLLHLLQYICDIWAFFVPFLWHRVHCNCVLFW